LRTIAERAARAAPVEPAGVHAKAENRWLIAGAFVNERTFRPSNVARLEDPERLKWLPPAEIVARFGLRSGEAAADIGAGTGYFAVPMAARLAPGKLYAVDFQPEMLELLRARLAASGAPANIELVRGEASASTLPDGSVDFALLANVWHELDHRERVLCEARRILRPRGRLAILDWRRDVSVPPGPPLDHRVPVQDTIGLLEANGWEIRETANWPFTYLVIAAPVAP
jgi:SAM-dependent methyltransferase